MKPLDWLGVVVWEPSCVVQPDEGSIVRHARPLTAEDAAQLREQAIARMQRDPAAVLQRERRIAIEQGTALAFTRKRA